ncbi:MAG: ECF transporter S component [Clostridia bacterium]|nr:ECF transporter S component [Clostridia bacterium]
MHSKIQRLVSSALMTALVCVATVVIRIPSPMKGYVNLGDGMVLASGWLLSPGYGFLAAALGSALADVFAGYVIYAPATFLIKGGMALIAAVFTKIPKNDGKSILSQLIGGVLAETVMMLGYFAFEWILYGVAAAAINLPANLAQAVAGLIVGIIAARLFERMRVFPK